MSLECYRVSMLPMELEYSVEIAALQWRGRRGQMAQNMWCKTIRAMTSRCIAVTDRTSLSTPRVHLLCDAGLEGCKVPGGIQTNAFP